MKASRAILMRGLLGLGLALSVFAGGAQAAQTTRSVLVAPNETGEVSREQQSVFNVARLKVGFGTGTCSSNAVTINTASGLITTESLSTAAGSTQAITLTSNKIQTGDIVMAMVDPGSSAGTPTVVNTAVSASTAVFLVKNVHATNALNAAIKIMFVVLTKGNPN